MEWTNHVPEKPGYYVVLDPSRIYQEQQSVEHVSAQTIKIDEEDRLWAKNLSFYGPIEDPPR